MLIMYILVVGAKSALARVSNVQEAVLVTILVVDLQQRARGRLLLGTSRASPQNL